MCVCMCVWSQLVCMPAAAVPPLSRNQGEIAVWMRGGEEESAEKGEGEAIETEKRDGEMERGIAMPRGEMKKAEWKKKPSNKRVEEALNRHVFLPFSSSFFSLFPSALCSADRTVTVAEVVWRLWPGRDLKSSLMLCV